MGFIEGSKMRKIKKIQKCCICAIFFVILQKNYVYSDFGKYWSREDDDDKNVGEVLWLGAKV